MIKQEKLLTWLNDRFAEESEVKNSAKYDRLYQVIASAIRECVLSPGDRLPPEQVLSAHMPLSQMTVRKCFALLAERGVISREHGRGTFVSTEEHGVSDLWHFRFHDPEGQGFMPIFNRILSRSIRQDTDIAELFPECDDKFVCIVRAVNIGSRFNCYSELFLPAQKFARIIDEPIGELERVNLKDVLAQEFRAPTLSVDQSVLVAPVPIEAAGPIGVSPGSTALSLIVTGYTFDDQPISHQKIWIPETPYKLNLPATAESVARLGRRIPLEEVANG